jgi:hypothetical protein
MLSIVNDRLEMASVENLQNTKEQDEFYSGKYCK